MVASENRNGKARGRVSSPPCAECGYDPEVDDDNPLYECSACGEEFTREDSANGDSHRCPTCGTFSRRIADHDCDYVLNARELADDSQFGRDPMAPRNCGQCGQLHKHHAFGKVKRLCWECAWGNYKKKMAQRREERLEDFRKAVKV